VRVRDVYGLKESRWKFVILQNPTEEVGIRSILWECNLMDKSVDAIAASEEGHS